MGLYEMTSNASAWRGYEYFKQGKAADFVADGEDSYSCAMKGSDGAVYDVHIDVGHPRKSHCNCPHADGKRTICKHMMALYFQAVPGEVERYEREIAESEAAAEREEQMRLAELRRYVMGLTKTELQEQLIEALDELDYYKSRYW